MVKPRELSICVQVLDVNVEPDMLHVSWEVQILVYFTDPSLKGVPEQTTGASGKVYGSGRLKKKKRKGKKIKEDLWESVPRQFFIANAVDIHCVRPDKFRVLNANSGTCKQTTHARVRTYHPLNVTFYPYDRHDLNLIIQATNPCEIATFGRQPVFFLGKRIKHGDVPLCREWKIECHGVKTDLTPKHESFTSSSYSALHVCLSIKRKRGAAAYVTVPFAHCCVFLSWLSAVVSDSDYGFMLLLLAIIALTSVVLGSNRPNVTYVTALDHYIRVCFVFGIFPVAICHGTIAFLSPAGIGVLNDGLVTMGRQGTIGFAFLVFVAKWLHFAHKRYKEISNEEYNLELRRAGQPKIDLPKEMSVFTLWEMNRFLKKKQDSSSEWLGSEWFDRSEPEPDETDDEHYMQRPTSAGSYMGSSPYRTGRGTGNRTVHDNIPKIAEVDDDTTFKKSRKKKLPPLFSDTLRNKPNLSSSADEGGISDSAGLSGKEEWLKDKSDSPKRVTFRPLGGLQDNKLRKKMKPSTKMVRIGGK